MRLDFNVLWVDDQQKAVQAQRERIERQIRKEGFRLQVKFASSVAEAKEFLSSDIFGDHIDLILMDYDLGAGTKGDEGLAEVRRIFPYKDIIFYSSQASDLFDKVAKQHVQGVFCSPRDELADSVDGAFETLVKKVVDIDHSRGIVMGATSDIDHHVSDSLVAVFKMSDEAKQAATLDVLKKHLEEKRVNFKKEADFIEAVKHVSELLDKHNVYTSNDRLRLLKNALEINALHTEKVDGIRKYLNEVVPKRNQLAHVQVQTEGFSRKLVNKKGEEFTSEDMKELRRALLEHQELFEALAEELTRTAP
jgi:CheY-like chemotaxis protein